MSLKTTLTVLFGISIVVANITAAKLAFIPLPVLGDTPVPAGFVAFGAAFLLSDLLTEYYGEKYASKVIYSTVAGLVFAYVLVWVSISLPTAPFYDGEAFDQVMGGSAAVIIASVITLTVSQRFDVWVFSRINDKTNGKYRWLRNCTSTGLSQIIDTVMFITLAFAVFPTIQGGDPMWGMALVATIVGQYIAKLVVAAVDTPLFYLITEVVEKERV